VVEYEASEVGGEEEIIVSSSRAQANAKVKIAVRVGGLKNLANISSNFWRLTGNKGRTNYNKCPGTLIQHLENHYGTDFLVDSLQVAVFDFFRWSKTPEGGGEYLVLGINDMSLAMGGLFDICGNWQPGHTFHRVGASVDIDRTAVLFEEPTRTVTLSTYQIDQLTRFMERRGGSRYPEPSIHYGFGGK
jgi:hypothetical protein